MNTTTILIENVIQGLQTFVWIALVTLSFSHHRVLDLQRFKDYLTPVSFLALALFYWLGRPQTVSCAKIPGTMDWLRRLARNEAGVWKQQPSPVRSRHEH